MQIEVIDGHSVATDLLMGLPVLDAGCRGMAFGNWFKERGHRVISLDPASDVEGASTVALTGSKHSGGHVRLVKAGEPGAWFIGNGDGEDVIAMDIPVVCHDWKVSSWDVIKLNIEGSEYDVLNEWPDALSRQVVVSFHEHTPRARGRAECDRLINKMRQWYEVFNQVWEERYCSHANYWDVLFIRKDLV